MRTHRSGMNGTNSSVPMNGFDLDWNAAIGGLLTTGAGIFNTVQTNKTFQQTADQQAQIAASQAASAQAAADKAASDAEYALALAEIQKIDQSGYNEPTSKSLGQMWQDASPLAKGLVVVGGLGAAYLIYKAVS